MKLFCLSKPTIRCTIDTTTHLLLLLLLLLFLLLVAFTLSHVTAENIVAVHCGGDVLAVALILATFFSFTV
jgi:hypothetical protein